MHWIATFALAAALTSAISLAAEQQKNEPRKSGGGTKLLVEGKYLHMSCARSVRDLARNRLECFGNVYIRRPGELLTSDYAILDMNTEQLHAEGNVVYFTRDSVIYGVKMDFNFLTDTGIIEDGRVESDKYQLLGEKIERLGPQHFKAIDGEYTTCRDCPASWRLVGRSIDLTVEGYAFLNHVFVKINDAPSIYLPAAILPVKSKRQTGFLFPRFQPTSPWGVTYVQPFFWAISRSMDATIAAGIYSQDGWKGEGEYRYVLSSRSHGQLNSYYLRDRQFIRDPYYNRWALNYTHNIELPWHIEQKLSYLDTSDRDYARKLGDVPGRGEPALVSEAGLSRSSRDVSIWVSAKRIHNQMTPGLTGFDYNTVQLLPSVSLVTADHPLFGEGFPLHWGVRANYSRFYRLAPSFDLIQPLAPILPGGPNVAPGGGPPPTGDFVAGTTPLRRAQRFNIVPELYYVSKLWDVLEVIPSVQYRTYLYTFDEGTVGTTTRGYLVAQTELATTIERIYGDSLKHKFRPSLTYSNIPVIRQDPNHAFIQQIKTGGYEFDENDIVPISSDTQLYFVPLGNSLTYRFGNKLILKDKGQYKTALDVSSGQSINFIEFRKPASEHREPLSRFFTLATVSTLRVQGGGEYYYYPYQHQSTYNLNAKYIFVKYSRRLLLFERSLGLRYGYDQVLGNSHTIGGNVSWSLNDYFSLAGGVDYQFPMTQSGIESPGVLLDVNSSLTFQSPSQCYRVAILSSWSIDNKKVAVTWNLPVNLTGEGFANLQEGGGVVPGSTVSK